MPETGRMIYLDNAATSNPKPPEVLEAVMRALIQFNANPGRSGHRLSLEAARTVLSCREALARLFGVPDALDIVMCFNCTDALNLAIKGSLRKGDHVIASVMEHNSVLRVIKQLEKNGWISVSLVAPDASGHVRAAAYAAQLRPRTRLAIITHASNVTGAIQPVADISRVMRDAGVRTLVDGAQVAGVRPVNFQEIGCALYAFPGHKGLLGPQGTGGLIIGKGITLTTLREGGTGSSSQSVYQPEELPERYESGTLNLPGIAGLEAGVRHIIATQAQRMSTEAQLTSRMLRGLSRIPGVTLYGPGDDTARRVGVVSFNVRDMNSDVLADALDSAGIAVRGGLHCAPLMHEHLGTLHSGAVRASVDAANTSQDIDALIAAVTEAASRDSV